MTAIDGSGDSGLLCPTSLREIGQLLQCEQMLCTSNLNQLNTVGQLQSLQRKQLLVPCYDSRLLYCHTTQADQPRQMFVALVGQNFDGHQFISQAIECGVQAVVYQSNLEELGLVGEQPSELLERMARLGIAAFGVRESRAALSLLSAHCFGYPSRNIEVLGVTGTDGKTSIAYLCYQILCALQAEPVGLLSTFAQDLGAVAGADSKPDGANADSCDSLQPNLLHQTTPESLLVQRALAHMLANGCRFAVVECSSHALSLQLARLLHVEFCAALFSNLSPEHLEFHGTMEQYARDKARLFSLLKAGGVAVWNVCEPSSQWLYNESAFQRGARRDITHLGYGLKYSPPCYNQGHVAHLAGGDQSGLYLLNLHLSCSSFSIPPQIPLVQTLWAENLQPYVTASLFDLRVERTMRPTAAGQAEGATVCPKDNREVYSCELGIAGAVYVANVAGALVMCGAVLQTQLEPMLRRLAAPSNGHYGLERYCLQLRPPKGRMERLPNRANFTVMVDYAHSPGAFARLLPELRAMLPLPARLLLLFGSAGQRDRQKRALQGQLAAYYGDIIVLCNEDPREEDEMAILQDIRAGIGAGFSLGQNLFLIPDRREAMAHIFGLAQAGDLVLLLGKGHESSIIITGGREIPWDERSVALELLRNCNTT